MFKCFNQVNNILLSESESTDNNILDIFRNKPFYFEIKNHNGIDCCFNHIIGLPRDNKTGKENLLFDYQELVYNSLQNHKRLWILKATGLGISEYCLRYMAYLCLKDDTYRNSQFVIVTGPNWDLSKKLIKRLKLLFEPKLNLYFDSKDTLLELNGVTIESFPSHHVDSFRSLSNPKFLFMDEFDFFPKNQAENTRAVAERYIAKSNPFIVLVSTPNMPDGLMQTIENEPYESCLYHRIKLDYRYGLNKIFNQEDIEKEKKSPSFDREYDLKYLGKIGNIYSQKSIDLCMERAKHYNIDSIINPNTDKYLAVDPAFSSSKFAILVCEWIRSHKMINIVYEIELDKPSYEDAVNHIFRLSKQLGNIKNIAVDSSAPEIIVSLKKLLGENSNWQYIHDKVNDFKKKNIDIAQSMTVVPISFNIESRSFMVSHSKKLLDDSRGFISINAKFDKLTTALRGAQYDETYKLDKENSPHNDILDCFQMLCTFFKFKSTND